MLGTVVRHHHLAGTNTNLEQTAPTLRMVMFVYSGSGRGYYRVRRRQQFHAPGRREGPNGLVALAKCNNSVRFHRPPSLDSKCDGDMTSFNAY
ncbi:hypothetical protein DAPPUDRAFT_233648 [Daphnia pulex]|uniref:Uncharacterized protein n=1 Tax=Daphnia pulex TaxID=6669 RepID=E9FVC9_DAPPU|nr:hypothetical protein DAPPUDRAFT_233648 [Daphnia pulex]|eukprot:EFX89129.1 hypothetical protein DAPPUDRAFT_233648 [Daphnia pulex]